MTVAAAARTPAKIVCLGRAGRHFDPAALHAANPERYPFLLESSAGAAAQGRYDIVFALPGEQLRLDDGQLTGPGAAGQSDFFAALDRWFVSEAIPVTPPLPFAGGWFIYLGYELAAQVEPGLTLAGAEDGLPTAMAVRCRGAVVRDRADDTLWIAAERTADLAGLRRDVAEHAGKTIAAEPPGVSSWQESAPDDYRAQVAAARDYILSGDVFQTNLSREWRVKLRGDTAPARLYASLRRANPAPFSGLLRWGDSAVICSSPERLIQLADGRAQTRPIAGTRARRGPDLEMTRELLAHPKERAEHVMLIDLERNDLGRVCEYGSVCVDELMTLESYAHVHHIVSSVSGRLRADVGAGAALRAVFPGGTITGCPKVRCMEIIAELEAGPRGAYTGAFGYLGLDGRMDSNILIRSLVQRGREISLRAGAGIVADSDPDAELAETRAKARGLLLALGIAP